MAIELPKAFVEQMERILGDQFPVFVNALNERPKISLRLNPFKPGSSFNPSTPVPWCKDAFYLPERPAFFKDPNIYAGAYYVQEASSMLIGQLGDFSKDLRILDLCAAPGGKSTLLSSRMTEGSLLVSNEIVRNRAEVLEENLSRWGTPNAVITHNHPKSFGNLRNFFDLVVIDAPCSGEGMFRKDPKVIQHWSSKMVQQCADRQREILTSVMDCLAPGGRLVYSTCTYNRKENEEIVQWLLDEGDGEFEIVPLEFPADWGLTPGDTEGFCPEMRFTYHCYPHKVAGEGFFFACLEKQASGSSSKDPSRGKGKPRRGPSTGPAKLAKQEKSNAEGWMETPDAFTYYRRGDAVEAIPQEWDDDYEYLAANLNILKAGIRIGEMKGGKLVPDHDLAMSEQQSSRIATIEVDLEQAMRYLSRDEMHLNAENLRDWAVVTHEGRNLGWVKVLNDRVNNHLPKHLRIRTSLDYAEFE